MRLELAIKFNFNEVLQHQWMTGVEWLIRIRIILLFLLSSEYTIFSKYVYYVYTVLYKNCSVYRIFQEIYEHIRNFADNSCGQKVRWSVGDKSSQRVMNRTKTLIMTVD